MGRKEVKSFIALFIGWMMLIFLLMTPEVLVVNRGYLVTKTFAIQYGLFGFINFIIFCISSFYFTPKFFQTKRFISFLLVCFASIILFGIFKYFVGRIFYDIVLAQYKLPGVPEYVNAVNFILISVRNTACSLLIGLAHRSFIDWIAAEKTRRELEKQKHTAEMAFLKMQVNPHFLFNALNNLYSLATLEKSNKTAHGIMKLSDMIRHMLYEKEDSQNKVSLHKEVAYLNSFIDLVKLRYEDGINIHFSIEGDMDSHRISPLLLFPLVENACKHGVLDDPQHPVKISLEITQKELYFTVSNKINNYLKDKSGGIGLDNIKKRLQLLYPNKHVMHVTNDAEAFTVELSIPF
ncbi:sensor histidine kinase [Chitinophaga skermanii]|nr:histidine kinase [Chitinophaga skermanii]